MQYRQHTGESLDYFITRARTQAIKCDFTDEELIERLIELIILSTPHEAFRKEFLGAKKGHTLKDTLEAGHRHAALSAGSQQITDLSQGQAHVDAIHKKHPCHNCGLSHKPRECPAFGDTCMSSHWAKMCRSKGTKVPQQKKHHTAHGKKKPKRGGQNKPFNAITQDDDSDSSDNGDYVQQYFAITISEQCLHSVEKSRH